MRDEHPDIRALAGEVKEYLREYEQLVGSRFRNIKWQESDGFLKVIATCAFVKQHDDLSAIADLVLLERGDAAVALLRSACETYIALKYVFALPDPKVSEIVLSSFFQTERLRSLRAQRDFVGDGMMDKEFGLSAHLADAEAAEPAATEVRKLLRQKLGWTGSSPSVRFMAEKTGEDKRYDYLYHATSRAVHFSVGELARRAWGNSGEMRIGFNTFEHYWATFSVSWGWRTYADTAMLLRDKVLIPLQETPLDAAAHDRLMALAMRIGALPPTQIITTQEFAWPSDE
jgi:hypothetical protein